MSVGYTPTQEELGNQGVFGSSWTSQGVPTDTAGRPLLAKWNTLGDPKTGLLRNQYLLTNQLDPTGLNALKEVALRAPGTQSKWAQMAESQQLNQLAQQQAGQQAQAASGLAMQGGLRSGARERLAQQGMLNQLRGGQGIRGQVAMQDEQQRLAAIQPLIGAQQAAAQYGTDIQGQNVRNTLNEVMQGRLNQANQYTEAMKAWAARETAKATPSSGGGGGCCLILTISTMALGGPDSAKAQDIITGSKQDIIATKQKYAGDIPAIKAIDELAGTRFVRDNICSNKERRGYYRFAEATIDTVSKYPLLIKCGDRMLVKPIAKLANGNKSFIGKLWIKFWGLIGKNKPFVRRNGEIV